MGTIKTQALVLASRPYRESSRMLTLITPQYGRIDACARGCRKPGSMLACAQPFSLGVYQLYQKDSRFTVTQAQVSESFYDLRLDVTALAYATYLCNLSGEVAQYGQDAQELFRILVQSLTYLSYSGMNPSDVAVVFLMKMIENIGYAPILDECWQCKGDPVAFSPTQGGVCCVQCMGADDIPMSKGALYILRHIQDMDISQIGALRIGAQLHDEIVPMLLSYIERQMGRRFKSASFIEKINHVFTG